VHAREGPPSDTGSNGRSGTRRVRLLVAIALGGLVWALPVPEGVDARGWHLLAIFIATVVGIVMQAMPMGAVAVVALATTALSGTLELDEVLSGFAHSTVWLIVAAFLVAGTFIRTGLGRRVAYLFMSLFGHRTLGLGYSLAATDLVLAPVIPSHTARAGGVVFPVLQSLASSAFGSRESPEAHRTAGFLTLTAYQTSCIVSGMFLTSMAANPLAAAFAAEQGIEVGWGLWALAAVVPGGVSLAVVPTIVYALHPPAIRRTPAARDLARERLAALGPMGRDEWILLGVFVGLLLAWSLGRTLGIESATAAFGALGVLLIAGVLRWSDVVREHEAWNTFVWFATLVMMATELGNLGVTSWFAASVTAAMGDVGWQVGFLAVSLAYFYSHYFFASNTAHVTSMYAPFLVIALALGSPPLLAALTLGFFSNLFAGLTHYAAGAAPVFFGPGYVTLGTWWKVGGLVSVVNITTWLVVGGLWWKLLGLW
jgi:DASS family divalent anion:Na+ symporter